MIVNCGWLIGWIYLLSVFSLKNSKASGDPKEYGACGRFAL